MLRPRCWSTLCGRTALAAEHWQAIKRVAAALVVGAALD
jgi:hypothetical protein